MKLGVTRRRKILLFEKSSRSNHDPVSKDAARYAAAGKRLKIGDGSEFYPLLLCVVNDCTGEGMLAYILDARGQPKQAFRGAAAFWRHADGAHYGFSFGQRARLVDHQGVDFGKHFKSLGISNQDARLCAAAHRD